MPKSDTNLGIVALYKLAAMQPYRPAESWTVVKDFVPDKQYTVLPSQFTKDMSLIK